MNTLRMITIVVVALSMGLAFSHLMQLPSRMHFDGPTWLTTQRVFPLYASIGGAIEIGSIILTGILAAAARGTPVFGWNFAAAACLLIAFIVWIVLVAPANAQIAQWTANSLSSDWTQWRMQWEYSHAARFILQLLGFSALLISTGVFR